MLDFRDTPLFRSAFSENVENSGSQDRVRTSLVSDLEKFRRNAEVLAEDVARSVPQLTDHSVKHLDALWDVATCIAGPEIGLNPVEGFVFGGAVLLHDLGNAVCAFPGRQDDLRGAIWDDLVFSVLAKRFGRRPRKTEVKNISGDALSEVLLHRLRQVHSDACIGLALNGIADAGGRFFPLIENESLRGQLGHLTGRIAASHHWPIDRVERELNIGDTFSDATDWKVDALKLACLLRCADACPIDRRRADPLQEAIRRPSGDSVHHWHAQQRLNAPTRNTDTQLIEFRSNRPFRPEDRFAWQVTFDLASRCADKELRDVESLFRRLGRPCFAAKGVAGADSPESFSQYVKTEEWRPVDISVRVTDVASVIERFGGKSLYGNDSLAPLRELLANSADAIRARRSRIDGGLSENEGRITVRLYQDVDSHFLEVTDDGIGMSENVIRGPLLDFGKSFWTSDLASSEFPGLISGQFRSTGKFGIGFFSVFMIAEQLTVISQRYDRGREETVALVLDKGNLTPYLRVARQPTESISTGGTRLILTLSKNPWKEDGICGKATKSNRCRVLRELIASIAPVLDVDIQVAVDDEKACECVVANDWLKLSYNELYKRVSRRGPSRDALTRKAIRVMNGEDQCGLIRLMNDEFAECAITVGGFLSEWKKGCVEGILIGSTNVLARNSASPMMTGKDLARILQKQEAGKWNESKRPAITVGSLLLQAGIFPESLPMFYSDQPNAITFPEVIDWAREIPKGEDVLVVLKYEFEHDDELGDTHSIGILDVDPTLGKRVLLAPTKDNASLFRDELFVPECISGGKPIRIIDVVTRALSEAWSCQFDQPPVLLQKRVIGTYELQRSYQDVEIELEVAVIKRPNM